MDLLGRKDITFLFNCVTKNKNKYLLKIIEDRIC